MENNSKNSLEEDKNVLKYFFLGIVIFLLIQTLFMYGGMLVEKNMQIPITGMPSAMGLTIVLIIGLLLAKKSKYILLGSFTLAFISPLILGLIIIFKAMDFLTPNIYYSMIYLVVVILIIWIYYINKILKNKI
ncbi:MAG: hypothetical protein WC697_00325 [Patescibacteria group bacterium]|jgi:hypothetical protein